MENTNLHKGMLPPQAIELEEGVIGAMMVDSSGVEEAMVIITSEEVFYKEPHKHIFVAIRNLFNAGNPIDLLTVSAELRKLGTLDLAGGDFNLVQLTQKISSSAHIEYHTPYFRSMIFYCDTIHTTIDNYHHLIFRHQH